MTERAPMVEERFVARGPGVYTFEWSPERWVGGLFLTAHARRGEIRMISASTNARLEEVHKRNVRMPPDYDAPDNALWWRWPLSDKMIVPQSTVKITLEVNVGSVNCSFVYEVWR